MPYGVQIVKEKSILAATDSEGSLAGWGWKERAGFVGRFSARVGRILGMEVKLISPPGRIAWVRCVEDRISWGKEEAFPREIFSLSVSLTALPSVVFISNDGCQLIF